MWGAFALGVWLALSPGVFAAESTWKVTISSPADGETIHENEGNVRVVLAIEGAGEVPQIRLLLDGKPYGSDQRSSFFALQNINRGEHILQAQLVNSDGQVMFASQTATFYLWRVSALFPGRGKK